MFKFKWSVMFSLGTWSHTFEGGTEPNIVLIGTPGLVGITVLTITPFSFSLAFGW